MVCPDRDSESIGDRMDKFSSSFVAMMGEDNCVEVCFPGVGKCETTLIVARSSKF